MGSLSIGQIVLANFPFSDLNGKKLRPCLVIGLAELGDVILCQITSKPYGSKKSIPLANNDFLEGSIAVDSFIRPDKIATLDTKLVDQLLGTLKSAKLDNVKMVLKKALEIN